MSPSLYSMVEWTQRRFVYMWVPLFGICEVDGFTLTLTWLLNQKSRQKRCGHSKHVVTNKFTTDTKIAQSFKYKNKNWKRILYHMA